MKPHIICHMLSSVDGRINGEALEAVTAEGEYEATAAQLGGDAWICGRTTMQRHFAEEEPFVSASHAPAGPQPAFVGRRADSYAISVDTRGKLRWAKGSLDDDHLICVLSEQAPADYLDLLREKGVSYVVCGASSVDLARAVYLLGEHFAVIWKSPPAMSFAVKSETGAGGSPQRLPLNAKIFCGQSVDFAFQT